MQAEKPENRAEKKSHSTQTAVDSFFIYLYYSSQMTKPARSASAIQDEEEHHFYHDSRLLKVFS